MHADKRRAKFGMAYILALCPPDPYVSQIQRAAHRRKMLIRWEVTPL